MLDAFPFGSEACGAIEPIHSPIKRSMGLAKLRRHSVCVVKNV